MSIATKLRLISAFSAIMLIALASYLVGEKYYDSRESRQHAVRQTVEVAHSVLEWAYQLERSGSHTQDQAQTLAKQALASLRYSGDEYFWLQDVNARIVMHPFSPELAGQDVSGTKDTHGQPIFTLFAQTAQKTASGGLAEYSWPRPGQSEPEDKFAHVKEFQPWGWIVGSGVYVGDLHRDLRASMLRAAAAIALTVIVSLLLIASVRRSIAKGLAQAIDVARAISQRDLSISIAEGRQDEVGQLLAAMRTMRDDLRGSLLTVHDASNQLAQASEQIAAGNANLSSRTENTAANLEETAASMEQLTSSVTHNAQAAHSAAERATVASSVAAQGGQAVSQVVETMHRISDSSRRIADIIGVIDGIAFQTNILALNGFVAQTIPIGLVVSAHE